MNNIPQSDTLTTVRLGKIFTKTVATYKYFWFISILQIHAKTGNLRIDVWDSVVRMVANAWYPIHYFRLSFGKSDSLFDIVIDLQKITNLTVDSDIETIIRELKDNIRNSEIKSRLKILTLNVPFRFLRPWIDTSDDKDVVRRSKLFENGCLYSILKDNSSFCIEINSNWDAYIHNHYNILIDFTYWNLTQFLQARNPNVPAISNKLIKPIKRDSLANQHRYWDMIIEIGGPIRCIYTGKNLYSSDYELDHFLPWSFVSHNLNWNLIPSNGSINSSKSNKLPDLSLYLCKLADIQHKSLSLCLNANKEPKILEDYLSLGYTPRELVDMNDNQFRELYERTFNPMNQIALNMGYETWKFDGRWK